MTIETSCSKCSQTLRVPDSAAGKKARCPECGGITDVPISSAVSSSTSPTNTATGVWEETWHVRLPSGDEYGPVSRNELNRWMNEGRVNAQCLLRNDQQSKWRHAAEVFPNLATQYPVQTSSHASPASYSGPRLPAHRGPVILVLGLLAWLGFAITAPFAWYMGASDLDAMAKGRMDPEGETMTRIGMWLGAIQTVLIGLMLVAMIGFFILFIAMAAAHS